MAVELIIAPPAAGKTAACIERIRRLLLRQPLAQVRVVLPDRLQTAAFKRRLAMEGGALGVRIGTFGNLYQELLDLARQPIPVAKPALVHRLALAALEGVYQAGGLQHYAGLRQAPGFGLALRDAFAELKRALVYPEDFAARSPQHSPAQQELAVLYQGYQDLLRTIGWADPEGLSWLAVEALQTNSGLAARLNLVVVDGFDSFTNAQRRTLQLLARTDLALLVTLPGERGFRRPAHRRFATAYRQLAAGLPLQERHTGEAPRLPAALRHLEANLFSPSPSRLDPQDQVLLIEARSPAEEAREALRWLKARVARDGFPPPACAVVTPDPDQYHPFLRQAAAEFGVPLSFTQGEPLARLPAAAALLSLISLPAQNFPRRALLDAVRSPYFQLPGFEPGSAAFLDEISHYAQVLEGRSQWDEACERLEKAQTRPDRENDEALRNPHLPQGAALTGLRQALAAFFDSLAPAEPLNSLAGWVRWLEERLDAWNFARLSPRQERDSGSPPEQALQIEPGLAARDQEVINQLRDVLRALVVEEQVAGVRTMELAHFVLELQGALEGVEFQEPPPEPPPGEAGKYRPAIQVLRMLEARGVRYKAVAILGLSEGIFPAVERADPFLDEPLRQGLGLESRLQREQPGLFYQALTRADKCLLLTRPYLAKDGERREPSPYWNAVQSLLLENCLQTIRPDDPRPLSEAASPQEALFWAVRAGSLPAHFEAAGLEARWAHLQHARGVLRVRLAEQASGPYEGFPLELAAELQKRFGPAHTWSVSRLEAYAVCPQQFFAAHVLGLESRPAPDLGLDSAQLGSLLHAVLEQAYRSAADPADLPTLQAALLQAARQRFARAPDDLGFRPSPLWQVEQEQYLQKLLASVAALAEKSAGWRPVAFEQSFGLHGSPPLELHTAGGQTVRLHGLIDRIDRDAAGNLRIIDYKTGSNHLSMPDLSSGRRLQLPLYALAARQALGPGEVREGLYWVILKGDAGTLKLSKFAGAAGEGPQAAFDTALEHVERIVEGIQQALFPPQPLKGGCPSYCPAAAWCWRYKPEW